MKNNKLKILLEAMQKIDEQRVNNNGVSGQKNIKTTFDYKENVVTAFAPQIDLLQKIFPQIQLADVKLDFSEYVSLPSQIMGKRSSKIIISKSKRYCIKIIEQEDMKKISEIFDNLQARFRDQQKNCLIKIYFMFAIEYVVSGVKLTERYIVMPHIRSDFDHCIKTFDIKGHLEARMIDEEDSKDFKFGKDENFIQSNQLKFIRQKISKQKMTGIIQILTENIQFLSKQSILDYSLLFSLEKKVPPNISNKNQNKNTQGKSNFPCQLIQIDENTVLKWAIIDYFQIYNDKKKMQNRFKSIFWKSVSSVEPQVYSKRLTDFLFKYLLG